MKYEHLVKKLTDLQEKISKAVNQAEADGLQDADTHAKLEAADAWLKKADIDLGEAEVPSMTPDITPMVEFSNKLNTYQKAFDPHMQSIIEKYREYVQELFQMVEEADIKRR